MNVIVTGARGFVGSRVCDRLTAAGHALRAIGGELLRGKMTDGRRRELERIFDSFRPDAVVHTAAISDMAQAQNDESASYLANVQLAETMALFASKYDCKLIICSSDQVYNGGGDGPHTEDERCAPSNVYGRHKLEAEARVAHVCPSAVMLRLTWMYDLPMYGYHTNVGLPLRLIIAAANDTPVEFNRNLFRGVTYVRSVAENIEKAITLPGGVYNFGSENDGDMYATALSFMSAMGLEKRAERLILPTDGEQKSIAMDCSKLKSHGISFETTADGIKKMIADYRI